MLAKSEFNRLDWFWVPLTLSFQIHLESIFTFLTSQFVYKPVSDFVDIWFSESNPHVSCNQPVVFLIAQQYNCESPRVFIVRHISHNKVKLNDGALNSEMTIIWAAPKYRVFFHMQMLL